MEDKWLFPEMKPERQARKMSLPTKTSTRALLLFRMLHYETEGVVFKPNYSVDVKLLKYLGKHFGRDGLYALLWTVAHKRPVINGSESVMSLRYISYHANAIAKTDEFAEVSKLFGQSAMLRVEDSINEFFENENAGRM